MSVRVEQGDSREVLKTLADCSVASIVTDPPYALVSITKRFGKDAGCRTAQKIGKTGAYERASRGFMGQTWDTGDVAFDPEFWIECWRVVKPGGHLLAFGGTRTYHRLACAIEDGGFEVRDTISWLYGSGFPKSHNVGRTLPTWEGWGTALKPAMELICIGRKPLIGTVAANVLAHGTGALNIDGCRIEGEAVEIARRGHSGDNGIYGADNRASTRTSTVGRWPANVVHDGSEEVVRAFPDSGGGHHPAARGAGGIGNDGHRGQDGLEERFGDNGSAARFFYSSKADADDRLGSKHPTVKPIDLMRWLVRLVTPPGGLVLDPFAGSGTTGMACMAEGFDCLMIEREAQYVADIRRRLAHVHGTDTPLFSSQP